MKRPLLTVALLYLIGILAGSRLPLALPALFALSFVVGFTAILWDAHRPLLLCAFLILAGWTNISWRFAVLAPDDLRTLLGDTAQNVTLRGVIRSAPVPRLLQRPNKEAWRTTVCLHAEAISFGQDWQPAFGDVLVRTPGLLPEFFVTGQRAEISGVLERPPRAFAEGLFDPRAFYECENIFYQLQTSSTNDWSLPSAVPIVKPPLSDRFTCWATNTLALGLPVEDEPLRLIWTLALDWKTPLTEKVEEPFLRAGTFHIFAVDGLRIGLLTTIAVGILRAFRISRGFCGVLVLPLIWAYAGLTGWPASASRAAVMMSVIVIGWVCRRPQDLVNSLCAAALIILLWEPRQLFQPGFQLSFAVVLCIALVLPPIDNFFKARFAPDPFLPPSLQRRPPEFLIGPIRFALDTFTLSLAAWLGSIPLAAFYFHLFTPISVPANFFVVPMTALALMSAIGSLLTGAWFPALAVIFNHSTWFWMKCIISVSQWFANISPGFFYVSAPSALTIIGYYLILLLVSSRWLFHPKTRRFALTAITTVCVLWLVNWQTHRSITRLHILPLDGAAVVFADPSLLLDSGEIFAAETILKPFLHAQGVNRLEAFALTVARQQQIGGAQIILDDFHVRRVLMSPAPARSPAYRRISGTTIHAGQEINGWNVLYPADNTKFSQADDNAMVLQRTISGQSILLLSTLGYSGQSSLIETHPALHADIIISGLPARDEPLDTAFLDTVCPKLMIIVDSEFPATRRASSRLRERLSHHNCHVIYTRDVGSLALEFTRKGCHVTDTSGSIQ